MTPSPSHRAARRAPGPARRGRGEGYTLVALIVVFSLLTVALAVAMPMWTTIVKRDREEELIFRGLQYAEAIRVFQLRFGRYPVRLKELIEVNPRCIRQLWKDPMTESGEWGLVFAQPAQAGGGGGQGRRGRQRGVAPQQQPPALSDGRDGTGLGGGAGGDGVQTAVGPILGVHSLSEEKALRSFLGGSVYKEWLFNADILPVAAVLPGSLNVPRPTSEWIGKPFPPGLEPAEGTAPGQPAPNVNPADDPDRRRERRRRSG